MITQANHYTLAVSNIDNSFRFYREVLGLKPLCKWEKGAYFLAGDFWFCLNVDTHRKPLPDRHYTHFAFSVSAEHFHAMVQHLKKAGVATFKDSQDGQSFYFLDPDGYKLELHVGTWQERLAERKQDPWEGAEFFC